MSLTGEATWVPAGEGAVPAWVHTPQSGRARSHVLIVPPLGREGTQTARALRVLAYDLAVRGHVAIRFTDRGFGDATDFSPDDPPEYWRTDIRALAAWARAELGATHLTGVGLRWGATCLVDAADGLGLDTLVLWDPVPAGKRMLREQQALLAVALPHADLADDGSVDLLDARLPQRVADAVRGVSISRGVSALNGATPLHLLVRDDHPIPPALAEIADCPEVTTHRVSGQRDLLDVTVPLATVPRGTLDLIGDLVDGATDGAGTSPVPSWEPRRTWQVEPGVWEDLVAVGAREIPAVLTRGEGTPPAANGFFATGTEGRDAPSRLPVIAARHLAARRGEWTIRGDRALVGEASDPRALREPTAYSTEGVGDAIEMLRFVREESAVPAHRVRGMGVCLGAWLSLLAAPEAGLGQVIAINNIAWSTSVRLLSGVDTEGLVGPESSVPAPTPEDLAPPAHLTRTGPSTWLRAKAPGLAGAIKRHMPDVVWNAASRANLVFGVEPILDAATSGGARVDLIFVAHDRDYFVGQRGPAALTRLTRRGRVIHETLLPGDDHSLHTASMRDLVLDEIMRVTDTSA